MPWGLCYSVWDKTHAFTILDSKTLIPISLFLFDSDTYIAFLKTAIVFLWEMFNILFKFHFAPKRVGVRGLLGEFSPQPEYLRGEFQRQLEYQIFTKMTQKEWLNMKISQK